MWNIKKPSLNIILTMLLALGSLLSFNQAFSAVDPARKALSDKAMNTKLPIAERVSAIHELYPNLKKETSTKLCVWDIAGKNGPIYNEAVEQVTNMLEWGIKLHVEAYTSESVLSEDFKAGQCDAALFTGLRARLYNKYMGTLDAVGAVPSEKHMKLLMTAITQPKNADRMVEGKYVVMGYAPMGAAYIFVNDKKINTLAKAAGKKVAVLDYDMVQAEMVQQIGANPVPTALVSAGAKFNNRVVDVLPAPLVAYNVMELYKGIGTTGGIVNHAFSQITLQMVGNIEKFPNELAQLIREDFVKRFDRISSLVKAQIGDIPDNVWIEIPPADKEEYQILMQEARIQLRERDYYDKDMLTLQRKVRCKFNPANFECANPVE